MNTEGRLTRSRARLTGQTPLPPSELPARTPRTRSKTGAVATHVSENESLRGNRLAFDDCAESMQSPPPQRSVALASAVTPTGLGISSILPATPVIAGVRAEQDPTTTPSTGVPTSSDPSSVALALSAAIQNSGLPITGPTPSKQAAEREAAAEPAKARSAVSLGRGVPAPSLDARCAEASSPPSSVSIGSVIEAVPQQGTPYASVLGSPATTGYFSPQSIRSHPPMSLPRAAAVVSDACWSEDEEEEFRKEASDGDAVAPVPPPPTVRSQVVAPSPTRFDPRSLRQIKKEIGRVMAAQTAREQENERRLLADLEGLSLGAPEKLQGMPTPEGRHLRFMDGGVVVERAEGGELKVVPATKEDSDL